MPQSPAPVDPAVALKMRAVQNLMEKKGITIDQGAVLPPEEVKAEMERLQNEQGM